MSCSITMTAINVIIHLWSKRDDGFIRHNSHPISQLTRCCHLYMLIGEILKIKKLHKVQIFILNHIYLRWIFKYITHILNLIRPCCYKEMKLLRPQETKIYSIYQIYSNWMVAAQIEINELRGTFWKFRLMLSRYKNPMTRILGF